MSKLAIAGGTSIRDVRTEPWPIWPVWGGRERERLNQVLTSGMWSYNGPAEQECLRWFSRYFSGARPLLVANGTVSIQLALEALDIGYGDEVIVPGLTWQATAAAVLDVNAVPVMVDVEPDTWCMDPKAFEAAVTPRTRAVIPVHLYGCTVDMDAVQEIAEQKGLFIIEDAAHKHGAMWRDRKVGTIGAVGSLSLQLSKVLTCGEGGLLLVQQDDIWERLEALRNCGRRSRNVIADSSGGQYGIEGDLIQSGNYRITEFQAAVLLEQCRRLDGQNELREQNARHLDALLESCPGITPMKWDERETRKTFFNYTFRYDEQELGIPAQLFRKALAAEIGFEVEASYQPLNDCSLYRPLTKKRYRLNDEYIQSIDPSRFHLPVCEAVYNHQSVTMHHKLLLGTKVDMEQVAQACRKIADHKNELSSL